MGKEATEPRLIINDLRGGRNGTEPPLNLRDPGDGRGGECVEAVNVDWWNASLARKRGGATAFPLQAQGGGASPLTGIVSFLGRHLPGSDDTTAALWLADDATPNPTIAVQRFTPSAGLLVPPIADPVTGKGWDIQAASIRGKYMLAYDSGVPRLHCWDPTTDTIRRTGLAAPAGTLAVADSGTAGTYPAVFRAYRVRVITMVGTIITHRSESGPVIGWTPSGTANGVVVTFPAPPGEGETHWELEVSPDNITGYWLLATLPIATTTYLDTALTSTYGSLVLSPISGSYGLQRSYRYLAVDQNRLLGFGSFTSTDPQNRLEFSAVAGSTNIADEERMPLANYIDLDEVDSGIPTGLIGPIYGAFYAFKYRQVWKLTPTGNVNQPYTLYPVSKVIGAISQNSIDLGEDATGNPCIYFMSTRGPYRLGVVGLEYLGLHIEDTLQGPTRIMNLAAAHVVAHTVYHLQKRQVWFWYATGFQNDPDLKVVFDIQRSAWSAHTGPSADARCSVMFARVIAASCSHDLKPYIGQWDAVQRVWQCDDDTVTTDDGEAFTAFVFTKPYVLGGLGAYCTATQGTVIAEAAAGVTFMQSLRRDFGKELQNSTVDLTPSGAGETRVMRLFDAGGMGSCWAVQLYLGDPGPVANAWRIDAVTLNFLKEQAVV